MIATEADSDSTNPVEVSANFTIHVTNPITPEIALADSEVNTHSVTPVNNQITSEIALADPEVTDDTETVKNGSDTALPATDAPTNSVTEPEDQPNKKAG